MKTAKELLIEMWGDKESYEKHETLTAMIEYAIVFASSLNNAK